MHIRGDLYISRWVLLTNLALVLWILALRGGRLTHRTTTTTTTTTTGTTTGTSSGSTSGLGARLAARLGTDASAGRAGQRRLLLAATLTGAGAIHAAVTPEHATEWAAAAAFFLLLTAAELGTAAALLSHPHSRRALHAARAISILPIAIWAYSRSIGLPFGPAAGTAEPIAIPDLIATALETAALAITLTLLRHTTRTDTGPARPRHSAHTTAIALTAILAGTAIALANTHQPWLHTFSITGNQSQTTMHMTH